MDVKRKTLGLEAKGLVGDEHDTLRGKCLHRETKLYQHVWVLQSPAFVGSSDRCHVGDEDSGTLDLSENCSRDIDHPGLVLGVVIDLGRSLSTNSNSKASRVCRLKGLSH